MSKKIKLTKRGKDCVSKAKEKGLILERYGVFADIFHKNMHKHIRTHQPEKGVVCTRR